MGTTKKRPKVVPQVSEQELEDAGGIEKHKIFVLKDDKSRTFGPPIVEQTRGMLIRSIQEGLQQGQAIWAKHPQDFTLFEIGEYDVRSGNIELYESKSALGLVQDFKISSDAARQ